jgi:uncharacterized membrane protein
MKQSPGRSRARRIFLPALLLIFTFTIVSAQAAAAELEYYGIETSVSDDASARTVMTIKFLQPVNSTQFTLNYPAYNLTSSSSFDSASCTLNDEGEKSRIACAMAGMTEGKNILTLAFNTAGGPGNFQGRYNFSTDYGISLPIKEAFILVKIPRSSVLSEEPANQSYAPGDGKILSDGKNIMVYWQRENLAATDSMRFSVSYAIAGMSAGFSNLFVVSIAGIVIISMIAVAVYVRRGSGIGKITAEVVTSVLNSDEKRVVDILARHGGKSGQKIIVRESDFSKAKVSRLVKNLKERGVVDIEPISGRENRIILRFEKRAEEKAKPERIPDSVIDTQADVGEI